MNHHPIKMKHLQYYKIVNFKILLYKMNKLPFKQINISKLH
jgi:hypothetical protein